MLEMIETEPKISLHALTGSLNLKTMRVVGKVGGQHVVILIDSGNTHNFLDPSIVKRGQLKTEKGEELRVRVANGELLTSKGKGAGVKITIQGNCFVTDTYVLSLAGCDMVLSVYWLRMLGQILWNFSNLTMEFTV